MNWTAGGMELGTRIGWALLPCFERHAVFFDLEGQNEGKGLGNETSFLSESNTPQQHCSIELFPVVLFLAAEMGT